MRLTQKQRVSIRDTFLNIFKNGEIYLFGSRVNDMKKGGDIDLYLVVKESKNLMKKKIKFLVELKRKIGEQKIDIVFNKDKTRAIEIVAIKNGILI